MIELGARYYWISRRRPLLHALAVLPPLIAATTYVLIFFAGTAPWWLDLGGSLVLMGSTVAAGALVRALARR